MQDVLMLKKLKHILIIVLVHSDIHIHHLVTVVRVVLSANYGPHVLIINTAVLDTVPVQCIRTHANKVRSCFLHISSDFVHKFAVIISLKGHK